MSDNLVAQPRLRWVKRSSLPADLAAVAVDLGMDTATDYVVLQQWWAQDLPTYMRDVAKGEWRDVEVVNE